MTLAEARAWRDEIRASDAAATVPTGHGPHGYFVQVWPQEGVLRLTTEEECLAFIRRVAQSRAASHRAVFKLMHPARSVLERLIDEAVGL